MVVGGTRMPVQARSVATRGALLDAALECLAADGYAAVTTTQIAHRAGVSRGGQLHHFPTKSELMTAAVEHLLERRLREFEAALADLTPEADLLDEMFDLAWSMFEGTAFIAWVELWVAARTNPDLAATMIEVDRRFAEDSRSLAVDALSGLGAFEPARLELLRDFAFAVMTGLAVQRLVPRDQRPVGEHMELLKTVARSMLDDGAR